MPLQGRLSAWSTSVRLGTRHAPIRARTWLINHWFSVLVFAMTSLASTLTLLPHLSRPLVLDEVEFIAAAQGIQRYGVPVYYRGYISTSGLVSVGRFHVHGLPGYSAILVTPDGFITAVSHANMVDLVGNWHPEMYLYLLAIFLRLPVSFEVAARLLNLVCLEASALLVYGIAAYVLSALRSGSVWQRILPLVASLAYVVYPFTTRETVLVDFTGTLSVTTVLLFWYVRLLSKDTWPWIIAQIIAFALIPWSNLGPVPAMVVALGAVAAWECLSGLWRRGLVSLLVLVGGLGLFGLTFELYSLWSGLSAMLTIVHNNAKVSDALAQIPYPVLWRHGGAQRATMLLWALTLGPVLGAIIITPLLSRWAAARQWRWHERRLRVGMAVAAALVTGFDVAIFSAWQGVALRITLLAAAASFGALARFFWANWLYLMDVEWLPLMLAVCVVMATSRLPAVEGSTGSDQLSVGRTIREMALFALVISGDLLLLGAQAWGFPKYEAPILAVSVPLLALLFYLFATAFRNDWRSTQGGAAAAQLLSGIGLLALLVGPAPTRYYSPIPIPHAYRIAQIAAALLLLVSAWVHLGLPGLPQLDGKATRAHSQAGRAFGLVAPVLMLLSIGPVMSMGAIQAFGLPAQRGSLAYLQGTSWGVRAAGEYLRAHVRSGDVVVVRKDIGFYASVPFGEDSPVSPGALQHPSGVVVWTARPSSPGPGFVLMWHGPEYNVYRYTPKTGANAATRG